MLLEQGVSDFCGRLDELLAGSKDPQRGFDVSIRAFTLYSPGNRVICGILRGFGWLCGCSWGTLAVGVELFYLFLDDCSDGCSRASGCLARCSENHKKRRRENGSTILCLAVGELCRWLLKDCQRLKPGRLWEFASRQGKSHAVRQVLNEALKFEASQVATSFLNLAHAATAATQAYHCPSDSARQCQTGSASASRTFSPAHTVCHRVPHAEQRMAAFLVDELVQPHKCSEGEYLSFQVL